MYENATLQEAYTGSLIAGKGKLLNNIKTIMDRTRFKNEDWARVRFGAGTPWRRCWCVISPPDEKEVQKHQKQMRKKSAYERSVPLKGNVKFYDTKKTKKVMPIATINDAFSAYAIYPQSKPLIEQSTLIKVEGSITIHAKPETTTEGFIFVMPEVHPAVSGFEMMLRFIFPLYDVFAMYGRPARLIADTLDPRSLMFALPQERRYGYLEILDVAGLIHEHGSQAWGEREWRKKLRELTSVRMTRMTANGRPRSRASSYRDYRNSLPAGRSIALRYEDGASIRSTPSLRDEVPPMPPPHTASAPPIENGFQPPGINNPKRPKPQHQRSFSENYPNTEPRHRRSQRERNDQGHTPSRLSHEHTRPSYEGPRSGRHSYEQAPIPPAHGIPVGLAAQEAQRQRLYEQPNGTTSRSSSEDERRNGGYNGGPQALNQGLQPPGPPVQIAAPPAFSHEPGAKPQKRPGISPDLRRANSRLSVTTLQQLAEAGRNSTNDGGAAAAGAAAAWRSNSGSGKDVIAPVDQGHRGVIHAASKRMNTADRSTSAEGMTPIPMVHNNPNMTSSRNVSNTSSQPDAFPPYYKDKPLMSSYDLLTPSDSLSRKASPLSQSATPPPDPASFHRPSPSSGPVNGNATILNQQTGNVSRPSSARPDSGRPLPVRSSTSHSITRKPVPVRRSTTSQSLSSSKDPSPVRTQDPEPPLPVAKQSVDSLHDRYIDEDALAQVLQQHTQSMTSESQAGVRDDESVYDNDSTVSPDYASTRKSTETKRSQRSVERPRRGVLRTVGTVEPEMPQSVQVGDATFRPGVAPDPRLHADIPSFDFGPTQYYDPRESNRPATSGTMTQDKHERPKSSDRLTPSPGNASPNDNLRSSESPRGQHNRSPSRNLTTPEPQLRGPSPTDDNQRSVVWQPGAQIGGSPGSRQSITPEQFVQQRAAASRVTPVYAHGRQKSTSTTPPIASRQSSAELPLKHGPNKLQKRNSSYGKDMPSRPHSRAASNLINASGDYSNHLSAREQEHVAKVTGSPYISRANKQDISAPGSGLIGAIEAREKEKKDIKEGLSGQMVQQAIAQRQQHEHAQRQSSYGAPINQYAAPQPQYTMPGGYPPSPGLYPYQPGQQYGWGSPPPQQQYQYYPQQQQQQQQQWTPPSAGQYVGQPQHPTHQFTRNASPQGQNPQAGYSGYFGNQGR